MLSHMFNVCQAPSSIICDPLIYPPILLTLLMWMLSKEPKKPDPDKDP